MAYDGKIMRRAQLHYEADRQARRDDFAAYRERIFSRQPRLREIENELGGTMGRIITGALRRGGDPTAAIARLRDENLALQAERQILLEELGLPADSLEEKPACPMCDDTGYQGERVCRCLRRYYAQEQQKELSQMLDLGGQSFDTFSLDWYPDVVPLGRDKSPRQHMEEKVYEVCVEYAHHFGRRPANLLLFGEPGLGKTHLSAAIAREVSAEGRSVVYDTAAHVFETMERQKFNRAGTEDEENDSAVSRLLTCDLLILDDLGTEMTTSFVQSALYQIVNGRLLEKRSTIISTNLSPDKLAQRYSPQLASRILGEYQLLPFIGQDIRRLKRERNLR